MTKNSSKKFKNRKEYVDKNISATKTVVERDNLTTIMITHNMKDAIHYGNRLVMMNEGQVILDIKGEEKKKLTVEDLISKFAKASGEEFADDKTLLS